MNEIIDVGDTIHAAPSEHPSGGEIRTKQADAQGVDINRIVKAHIAGNMIIPPGGQFTYGDFSGFGDYHECVNRVFEAQDEFMALPAEVRRLADNDVGRFLDLASTEEGLKALKEAGLEPAGIPAKPVVEPPVVEPPVEPA